MVACQAMSPPIEKLATRTVEAEAEQAELDAESEFRATTQVALREGRQLVLSEVDGSQLVEIRSESGQLEVRIQLTEAGPILQLDAVRMQLRAAESLAIEAKQVTVTATEELALASKTVTIAAESDVTVSAGSDLRMVGTMIYLN